jgi:CelD/BcsL family acetyltransferase involved in cellulose biosynthesis
VVVAERPIPAQRVGEDWQLEAWRAVVARTADPHPFVMPEWQRAWWEHFGDGELAVLRFGRGRRVAGVAAVHRDAGGCARFLGGDDLTDYPGPAVAPGGASEVAEGLVQWLRGGELGWRRLDVRNARFEDGFADAVKTAAERAGLPVTTGTDEPIAILELPRSWDDYLERLARQPRRELQRKERVLDRELPGALVRTADAGSLEADMGTLCGHLRQARGPKGGFMSPRVERFFRRVASDYLALGMLRLDLLEVERRPLAATVGFQTPRAPRAFSLYNMGFDVTARALSPGIILLGRLIRRALGDGLERFDFMRGLERYKLDLGATARHLGRVTVQAR